MQRGLAYSAYRIRPRMEQRTACARDKPTWSWKVSNTGLWDITR